MEYRILGKTGIEVSEIGMGCWAIGGASFRGAQPTGWAGADIRKSLETVKKAWDLGVTFFDTADAYGRGKSEVLVGLGLLENKDKAVIATKVGNSLAAPGKIFTEPYIRGALDASLTRLEVDCVDLYQLHNPDVETMTDELFDLMRDLKASGKTRAWGVSIGSVEEGKRAIEGGAETIQLVYNILQQEIGNDIFPLAMERGVGIIVRVPLASGWLTGKYNADTVFPPSDHRSRRYTPETVKETAARVAQLDFLLEEVGSLAEAALRFALSHPAVSTVIPGAKSPEQIAENAKASGEPLSEGALGRIKELQRRYG
jgi:aryl-alcohol dehydrogenase-like predicted oxidoreductase